MDPELGARRKAFEEIARSIHAQGVAEGRAEADFEREMKLGVIDAAVAMNAAGLWGTFVRMARDYARNPLTRGFRFIDENGAHGPS